MKFGRQIHLVGPDKKPLGKISYDQQEVGHFVSKSIFHVPYFNELLLQISHELLQICRVSSKDPWDETISKA